VSAKHGIPFYVDVQQAAATLDSLPALEGQVAAFMPGHGPAVREIGPWARTNAARLAKVREAVAAALAHADATADILRLAADSLGVSLSDPVAYCLGQTTVLACLSALQAEGHTAVTVTANRWAWRSD
jgi:hypothetical protein